MDDVDRTATVLVEGFFRVPLVRRDQCRLEKGAYPWLRVITRDIAILFILALEILVEQSPSNPLN